ncbi:hypothetical protein SISSUDRAFT_1011045 [Sistotremastrum suecicum HHB10207 ss-3]|uniref:ferric-chelate reductase (NADPH) n=1 Tax=Sistotremastrum suecicum HHB10207 ss-3 TaxID=1314776 RepID=A0A165YLE4_9AGAM|nr:hypothetical protein SISSUDRAFT_1011045 [Sistotremastrum suecicum HHB10207 ss-3]
MLSHRLSHASWWYAYYFWLFVAGFVILFSGFHVTGSRQTVIGAWWSKLTLRRHTWRPQKSWEKMMTRHFKHRQPSALPSDAQLFSLAIITIVIVAVTLAGPDYIAPKTRPSTMRAMIRRSEPVLTGPPTHDVNKDWWTVGDRTGLIAFALYPFVILLAVKAQPFAILSMPFVLQLNFDKLCRLHRYTGGVIWVLTALHVITWTVQLVKDKRSSCCEVPLWVFAWSYPKFLWGWSSFFFMTILFSSSLSMFREGHYEVFYGLHFFMIPLILITSALHHPPVAIWCWVALSLWLAERIWRAVRFSWINGIYPREKGSSTSYGTRGRGVGSFSAGPYSELPTLHDDRSSIRPTSLYSNPSVPLISPDARQFSNAPPPGYARADILPGNLIRLSVVSSRPFTWAPGQYALIRIPEISKFTSHPFTISSICDQATTERPPLVVLIAAKNGFTNDLWNLVNRKAKEGPQESTSLMSTGRSAILRTHVDGPFGSASRSRWAKFSTVVIIVGGSGVSFGLAIMQFLCLCMNGREAKSLSYSPGGFVHSAFRTTRVRFIWTVSEFAKIQWGASVIKRCMDLVGGNERTLQISIIVSFSRAKKTPDSLDVTSMRSAASSTTSFPISESPSTADLLNPTPESSTFGSLDTPLSQSSTLPADNEENYHPLDFTNFDGEDQSRTAAEDKLSSQIQKAGAVRRRATMHRKATMELQRRATAKQEAEIVRSPDADPDLEAQGFLSPEITSSPPSGSLLLTPEGDKESGYFPSDPKQPTSARSVGFAEPAVMVEDPEEPAIHMSDKDMHLADMDPEEAAAVKFLSEYARHGSLRDIKKIESILKAEKAMSHGALAVACCGPLALTAAVRKAVAAQIDPGAIAKGDMSGSISLMSEEFDY